MPFAIVHKCNAKLQSKRRAIFNYGVRKLRPQGPQRIAHERDVTGGRALSPRLLEGHLGTRPHFTCSIYSNTRRTHRV